MYFWNIWQTYSTGITKKELTNVEIQEQTASLRKISNGIKGAFQTELITLAGNGGVATTLEIVSQLQRVVVLSDTTPCRNWSPLWLLSSWGISTV